MGDAAAAAADLNALKKLRVVDLKERLSKLGLSTSGLKADLVERLYNALSQSDQDDDLMDENSSGDQAIYEPQQPYVAEQSGGQDLSFQMEQVLEGDHQLRMQEQLQHQLAQEEERRKQQEEEEQQRLLWEEEQRRQQQAEEEQRRWEEVRRLQEQDELEKRRQQEEMQRLLEEAERRRHQQEQEEAAAAAAAAQRAQEEMERSRQQAEMQRLLEEAERRRQEEEMRHLLEEAERRRLEEKQRQEEEMRRRLEEAERQRQQEEELRRKLLEEEEQRRQMEEMRRLREQEEERRRREEQLRLQRLAEEEERLRLLKQAELQRLEEERRQEQLRRQEEERRAYELLQKQQQEEEARRRKAEEEERIRQEAEEKARRELEQLQKEEAQRKQLEEEQRKERMRQEEQERKQQERIRQQQMLLEQQKLEEERQKAELIRLQQKALLAKQQELEEQQQQQRKIQEQQQMLLEMEEKKRKEEELFCLQQEALLAKQKEEKDRQCMIEEQQRLQSQQGQPAALLLVGPGASVPQLGSSPLMQAQLPPAAQLLVRPRMGLPAAMPQVAMPLMGSSPLIIDGNQAAVRLQCSASSQQPNEPTLMVRASSDAGGVGAQEATVLVHQGIGSKQHWKEAELQHKVMQQQMLLEQQKVLEAKQQEEELFRIQQEALIAKQKEEQERQVLQQKQLILQQQMMEEEKRRKEEELFRAQQEALMAQQREDEEQQQRKLQQQQQQRLLEEQQQQQHNVMGPSSLGLPPGHLTSQVGPHPTMVGAGPPRLPPPPSTLGTHPLMPTLPTSSQTTLPMRLPPSQSQNQVEPMKPPALMSLEVPKPPDDVGKEIKLPQALEKALAYKTEREQQVGINPEEMDTSTNGAETSIRDDAIEVDDDVEFEEMIQKRSQVAKTRQSKNKRRKDKKKRRAKNRQLELKKLQEQKKQQQEDDDEERERRGINLSDVEVDYIQDTLNMDPMDPLYHQFMRIFETFKLSEPDKIKQNQDDGKDSKEAERKDADLRKKPKDTDEDLEEEKKEEEPKLSKRKLKKLSRLSIAELKQHVARPDVVEMHDITAKDPKLLVLLKSTRNTVPVPRHWCFKRKYLQGKRGIEKPPFDLPDFIKRTGIMEMRQALQEKEDQKTLKAKMREKVRPKLGKIDIDYQKLHDAFFKWQTKPRMTIHGDLYYEGKEFETRLKEKKPGELSDELRTALGMPIGPNANKVPPPWLIAMQRYGPPPSYPNLKIPGLNAPIPDSCSFGYHAGGWGKPPVDEMGKPLYGDVFGTQGQDFQTPVIEEEVDRTLWGELESESESESEEEEEEEEEEEPDRTGLLTPGEGGLVTPSGLTSIPAGMETPDMIELRKRKIESEMEGGETPALYTILPEKKTERVGVAMMGSTHIYDIAAAVPGKKGFGGVGSGEGGVEVALDPSELDMDTAAMAARYEQTIREQQKLEKEDLSDMVAEHAAKQKNKRKKQQQDVGKAAKKYKEFKF